MEASRRAIFLDRDGTINKLNGLITCIDQISILDGVPKAIKIFKELGFLIIVITNQPVINMGLISRKELDALHNEIHLRILEKGGTIDKFLYCPHEDFLKATNLALAKDCNCRKPKSGLIDQALELFPINMKESWLIGDSWRDVSLANTVGIRCIQIVERSKNKKLNINQVYSLEQAATLVEAEFKSNET
jgi:mannose-1-phosphate guanylyltransferase/phosphomannomutase